MKQLIGAVMLFFLCFNIAQAYEVTEYKWVEVTNNPQHCPAGSSACYFHDSHHINMKYYLTETEYNKLLKHEYWHHIHITLMSEEDRKLWKRVTNKELMTPILEKYGMNPVQEFISVRAAANIDEDFAECSYRTFDWELNAYHDLKVLVANYLMNKYR